MAVQGIWLVRIALRAGGRVCGGKTAGAAGCSGWPGRCLLILAMEQENAARNGENWLRYHLQRNKLRHRQIKRHFLCDKNSLFKQSR